MKGISFCLALASVATTWAVNPALGGSPVYYSETGSYYEMVNTPLSYEEAMVAASGLLYAGRQGRLATIESEAENNFVFSLLCLPGNRDQSWRIGGEHTPGSSLNEGWKWVTGEPLTYTNWLAGEPNNGWPGEDTIYWDGPDVGSRPGGQWCDIARVDANPFIVEYPAPEPATLSLLALGGLVGIRRRVM